MLSLNQQIFLLLIYHIIKYFRCNLTGTTFKFRLNINSEIFICDTARLIYIFVFFFHKTTVMSASSKYLKIVNSFLVLVLIMYKCIKRRLIKH